MESRSSRPGSESSNTTEIEGQEEDISTVPLKKHGSFLHLPPSMAEGDPVEEKGEGTYPGPQDLRLVVVGKTGVGKSASANTILGQETFISKPSFTSITQVCEKRQGEVAGRCVTIVDTPGLFDTNLKEDCIRREIGKCVSLSSPGPHAILLVVKPDRFTKEEGCAVRKIQEIFGDGASRYILVLFTRKDDLKGRSIEECMGETDSELKVLLGQCGGRYHVFENNKPDDRSQVTNLLDKIDTMIMSNGGGCYTNEMYEHVERMIQQKEQELRRHYEEKLHQKEKELKARFQQEIEELKKTMQEKVERLEEDGRQRDTKMKEIEDRNKRELEEWKRYFTEKSRKSRQEAENSGIILHHISDMWKRFKKLTIVD